MIQLGLIYLSTVRPKPVNKCRWFFISVTEMFILWWRSIDQVYRISGWQNNCFPKSDQCPNWDKALFEMMDSNVWSMSCGEMSVVWSLDICNLSLHLEPVSLYLQMTTAKTQSCDKTCPCKSACLFNTSRAFILAASISFQIFIWCSNFFYLKKA